GGARRDRTVGRSPARPAGFRRAGGGATARAADRRAGGAAAPGLALAEGGGGAQEVWIGEPGEPLPPGLPWVIGVGDAVHVRSDAEGRALVGGFLGEDRAVDPDRYDTPADDPWTHAVLETAERVFGVVGSDAQVRHHWAGLYPTTPDRHPIIDKLAEGLFAALGF